MKQMGLFLFLALLSESTFAGKSSSLFLRARILPKYKIDVTPAGEARVVTNIKEAGPLGQLKMTRTPYGNLVTVIHP